MAIDLLEMGDEPAPMMRRLRRVIGEIAHEPIEKLVREADLGPLSFSSLRPMFEEAARLSLELERGAVERLPIPVLRKADKAYRDLSEAYALVRGFKFSKEGRENPVHQRDGVSQGFERQVNEFVEVVVPIVAFARSIAAPPVQEALDAARAVLDTSRDEAGKLQKTREDFEAVLRGAREATQKVGVAQHAVHFRDEAQTHAKASWGWLVAAVILAGVTGVAAWVNYDDVRPRPIQIGADSTLARAPQQQSLDVSRSIQLAVAKVILFSVLFTATLWCGRVYRAHRHNFVVNRHRQNALSSFETFVSSATDEASRNHILLQATQSIFAPQNTGYNASEPEVASAGQVVELIRTTSSSAKS